MTTITNYLKIFLTITIVLVTLVSCGNSDLKAVNEKIEKDGVSTTFTQKEYAAMVDYLDKNYMKMFKEFSKLDFEDDDIDEKFDKFENKYPHINEYLEILSFADLDGKLDKYNSIKLKKIIKEIKGYYKDNYDIDFNNMENGGSHTSENASIEIPDDAIRGDFDGDSQIDYVWMEVDYNENGEPAGELYLRSNNPRLNKLSWDIPGGVMLVNLGDLNNSNRDFLGAIPYSYSNWAVYSTYGFKNNEWKKVLSDFSVFIGEDDDLRRVWKGSNPGYVFISTNNMTNYDDPTQKIVEEVKLNF